MADTTLILLIAVAPSLAVVLLAAYVGWLRHAPPLAPSNEAQSIEWPEIDVMVAVFNESALLGDKLENLCALSYPAERLRFIIVDGASTDGSREIAEAWARHDERFRVCVSEVPGKSGQLNIALRHAHAPWIVVTDADARMPAETLKCLMRAASEKPALGLIGSPVMPVGGHPAEQIYWRALNWLRFREWCRGSASMVVGPCYAFRRGLIEHIPEDVVGDDVYIAWRLGSEGYAIGLAGPMVYEVRSPMTVPDLFAQKVRRSAGILREAFRFLPAVRGMIAPLAAAYLVRFALLLLGPPLVAAGVAAILATMGALRTLDSGVAALLVLVLTLVVVSASTVNPIQRAVTLFVVLPLAASVSVLMYPFLRQPPMVYRLTQLGKVP